MPIVERLNKEPTPTVYKLVDLKHAKKVAHGSFRIGTLESFGALENGRRDVGEGSWLALLQDESYIFPGAKAPCHFEDCYWHQTMQDAHALCFTLDPDTRTLVGRPQAVFEIRDVDRLAVLLSLNNPRLNGTAEWRAVYYEPLVTTGFAARKPQDVDPFRKDAAFLAEQEYRIVWYEADRFQPLIGKPLRPFVTKPNPEIATLCKRID